MSARARSTSVNGAFDIELALRAMANPGRRHALQLVSGSECSSGQVADACGWSRPATSQHLKVLREAHLVDVRRDGNRRLYRARQAELDRLRAFLDEFWNERLSRLAEYIDVESGHDR